MPCDDMQMQHHENQRVFQSNRQLFDKLPIWQQPTRICILRTIEQKQALDATLCTGTVLTLEQQQQQQQQAQRDDAVGGRGSTMLSFSSGVNWVKK